MNYFVHHQHQEFDPSFQNQESYDQSTNNYYSYSYSYSYANPQFNSSIHPYSYQNLIVQPAQQEEQEPNPPGVPPPPPPELNRNSYYQYHAHGIAAGVPTLGPQSGAVDAGVPAVVHQPIVQPLYDGVGIIDRIIPGGDAQIHLGQNLHASSYPFCDNGRGGGGYALPMNAAIPFQHQTLIANDGVHIHGGPSQLLSQSYSETHHGLRPKFSGGTSRARGRGKGCVKRKHATTPAMDQKLFIQGKPAESASVLPPPKVVSCEICKVECDTPEVLQQHMNGKKHKKKLKVLELRKLNERVIDRQTEQTSTVELKPEALTQSSDRVEGSGNQQLQREVLLSQEINEECKAAGEKRKVEAVEPREESTKKMRVDRLKLRGGKSNRKKRPSDGAKSSVQLVCELCNVKCESVVVFQSHLVGKKHKSKAKRLLGQEIFGQDAQRLEMQAVDKMSDNASTSIGL